MDLPVIVPDASVILKWAFQSPDEQDRDKALDLLNLWLSQKGEMILPKLWAFEVGNVLALKNPRSAMEIMNLLIDYRFPEHETSVELCRETFALMKQYRVTFYDGVYHAVARLRKGMLVTTDRAYYQKAFKAGNVTLLENFSITV